MNWSEQRRNPTLLVWDCGVFGLSAVMCLPGVVSVLSWENSTLVELIAWLLPSAVLLLVFVALYVALGRAALRRGELDEPGLAQDRVFVLLLVLLLGVATAIEQSFATLQTIAYPMIWTLVPTYGRAVVWSGALAASTGIGLMFSFSRLELSYPVFSATVIAIISFGFAILMGTWITRVYQRGEAYRALVDELRATQAEVVALSAATGAATERERMSRELHDTLTQTLAGLVMMSEQTQRALDVGDVERARDRMARVEVAARESVTEARALIATTQPLGDGGLEAAIERVAERLRADAGLLVTCELQRVQLDRERQVVLLRVAQEGMNNARKHAGASRVRVMLASALAPVGAGVAEGRERVSGGAEPGGAVLLRVEDDGVGYAEGVASSSGFGLSGLAERVRAVGGEVSLGASELGGALLEVRIALPAQNGSTL